MGNREKILFLGIFAIIFLLYQRWTNVSDEVDKQWASFYGKGTWEFYDDAPYEQNVLWRQVGKLSEKRAEAYNESNDVRKEEFDRQIIRLGETCNISDFVGSVKDINEDYVQIQANNCRFELYFSEAKEVWELNKGDIIQFSMKKRYNACRIFKAFIFGGAVGSAGLNIEGDLISLKVIGKT